MSQKHLTIFEREKILAAKSEGKTISQIAVAIGRNKSTVSRELRRNSDGKTYSPSNAQALYRSRRMFCKRELVLHNEEIFNVVKAGLGKHWSPEQIVGRFNLAISVPTIYRAFRSGLLDKCFKRCLRRRGKPYKRTGEETRGKLVGCKSIENRPAEVLSRKRFGDWEGDTVLGSPGTGGILTLVEMKSRFVVAEKINDKRSDTILEGVMKGLSEYPCLSITLDNGKEFACHKSIEEILDTEVYFAHPHSPWERGTNENTNGLMREFLPKGSDFRNYPKEYTKAVVDILNNRPRKVLGYKTPAEVFFQIPVAFGLTN